MNAFQYTDWGRIAYAEALEKQTVAFDALLQSKQTVEKAANQLFFCEHLPVLTLGKSGKETNLLVPEELLAQRGITLYHTNRGGDITYHGPGQITAYPIFDLEYWRLGLKPYIHLLEEIVIRFLSLYDVKGERLNDAAGVWIDPVSRPRKICAIGVRSSRYVTMHGLALNINTDLNGFSLINPCGFTDKGVTSVQHETGKPADTEALKAHLRRYFEEWGKK